MAFLLEKQAFKHISQRFRNFVVGLIRGKSLVTERARIAPVSAPAVEAQAPAERPCVNMAGMSLEEITAALDALEPANDTATSAKTPTNVRDENSSNAQAAPSSPAHGAAGCPVAPLTPLYTYPQAPRLAPLHERLKARQPSPLSHLFGTPASPFTPSNAAPSTAWSRSSAADKFAQAIRSSQTRKGAAITVNLSPAREKALRADPDRVTTLSTYISREMRKTLGQALPYAFQFEISPAGRLHVHGVVCLDQGTRAELDALKAALAAACGKISGHAGSRQVKVAELYSADGWTAYFSKTLSGTIKALGADRVRFVSRSLSALAQQDRTAPRPALAA